MSKAFLGVKSLLSFILLRSVCSMERRRRISKHLFNLILYNSKKSCKQVLIVYDVRQKTVDVVFIIRLG